MIDPNTITDEQIRECDRLRLVDHDAIEDALSTMIHPVLRALARARCARFLNAHMLDYRDQLAMERNK